MEIGTLLRLRNFSYYSESGCRLDYTAPKGKVFVAVLLGVEEKDGSEKLDHLEVFKQLGYVPEGD